MDLFNIIASYLSPTVLEKVLTVVQNFSKSHARLRISALLSKYVSEPKRHYLFNRLLAELEAKPYPISDMEAIIDEIISYLDVTFVRKVFKLLKNKNSTAIHKSAQRLADLGFFQEAFDNLLNIPFDETNGSIPLDNAAYKQLSQRVKIIVRHVSEEKAIENVLKDDKAFINKREIEERFWEYHICESIAYIFIKSGNLEQALRAIWIIDDNSDRAQAISSLGSHLAELPHSDYTLCQLLHYGSSLPRREFVSIFSTLIPLVIALVGNTGVEKMAKAIQDIGRWWP